jgi:hypothetical protein
MFQLPASDTAAIDLVIMINFLASLLYWNNMIFSYNPVNFLDQEISPLKYSITPIIIWGGDHHIL